MVAAKAGLEVMLNEHVEEKVRRQEKIIAQYMDEITALDPARYAPVAWALCGAWTCTTATRRQSLQAGAGPVLPERPYCGARGPGQRRGQGHARPAHRRSHPPPGLDILKSAVAQVLGK